VELTDFSGDVEVLLDGLDAYAPAQEGMVLQAKDKIKTAGSSSAELSFNEKNTNLVRLSENTEVEVSLAQDEKLAMTGGEVFSSISDLSSGSAFEIRTPTVVAGARGTDWVTKVTDEGTEVEALESTPYVRSFEADGTISQERIPIEAGQMTTVRKFHKPESFRPISDARRQEWQKIRQDVRRRAGEAVIKRQQRAPFDRQELFKKLTGKRVEEKIPAEKKLKIEGSKPAEGQKQANQAEMNKQIKPPPKKEIPQKRPVKQPLPR
jgi:hypothetical protein